MGTFFPFYNRKHRRRGVKRCSHRYKMGQSWDKSPRLGALPCTPRHLTLDSVTHFSEFLKRNFLWLPHLTWVSSLISRQHANTHQTTLSRASAPQKSGEMEGKWIPQASLWSSILSPFSSHRNKKSLDVHASRSCLISRVSDTTQSGWIMREPPGRSACLLLPREHMWLPVNEKQWATRKATLKEVF